jgi:hypothetical protein
MKEGIIDTLEALEKEVKTLRAENEWLKSRAVTPDEKSGMWKTAFTLNNGKTRVQILQSK